MFFLLVVYFAYTIFPFPWYFPTVAVLGILVFTHGLFHFTGKMASPKNRIQAVAAGWGLVGLCAALTFGLVAFQLRLQQRIIEDGVRIPMGKWLKANAAPDDRIYLECLGYVGYFSAGRMRDYTGLVTPEVVRLIREKHLDYYTIPRDLQPEWVVLRLREYLAMEANHPYFREKYTTAAIFENNDELNRHVFIPGESYLLYDIFFIVFHRRDLVTPLPVPAPETAGTVHPAELPPPGPVPGTGDGGQETSD
jgi:hypothetical protein